MNKDKETILLELKHKEFITRKILDEVVGPEDKNTVVNMIIENVESNLLTSILDILQINNISISTYIESRFI